MKRTFASTLALLSLPACTTSLSVSEVQTTSPSVRPTTLPAGMIYRLPAATIVPTAYLAIKSCKTDENADKMLLDHKKTDPKPVTEIELAVGGSIQTAQVPDQVIVVDYRNMQKFLKTSSVTINRYPNGTLKSVNASMEDETPDAIATLAAAAGSIALLSTGAPAAVAAAPLALSTVVVADHSKGLVQHPKTKTVRRLVPVEVSYAACTAETVDLLKKRGDADAARNKASDDLDDLAAKSAKLDAAKDQKTLDQYKAQAAKDAALIDAKGAEIADYDTKLRVPFNDVYTLDASGGDVGAPTPLPDTGLVGPSVLVTGIRMRPRQLDAFLAAHIITAKGKVAEPNKMKFEDRACRVNEATGAVRQDETCSSLGAVQKVASRIGSVTVKAKSEGIVADSTDNRPNSEALKSTRKDKKRGDGKPPIPGADVAANDGIIYVEPRKLTLEMRAPPAIPAFTDRDTIVKSIDVSVPQMGRYLALPLHAGFGQRSELQATFAEDGSLQSATFSAPKSSGKAIANTIKSLTDQAVSTRNAIEDRRTKLAKDRADTLASMVAAQASTKALTSSDPLADLNAEVAKANAQAALAEAQVRIKNANSALAKPDDQ